MSYEAGKQAALNNKTLSDNPHTDGFTKLGNVKLTEAGIEWEAGFKDTMPMRVASKEEMAVAMKGNPFSQRTRKRRAWK